MVKVGRVKQTKDFEKLIAESVEKAVKKLIRKTDEKNQEEELLIDYIKSKTGSVNKIKPTISGDTYTYEIEIDGRKIVITSPDMLTSRKFRQRYLEEFSKLISFSPKRWATLIDYWGSIEELVEDDPGTESIVAEKVIQKISECRLTQEKSKAFDDPDFLLCKDATNTTPLSLLYSGHHIQKIVQGSRIRVSLERIAALLKDYLNGSSRKERVRGSEIRFWQFDPKKFDVDWVSRWEVENG